MDPYKFEFVEFLISQKALLFGQFTLKSGRVSPYFFNAGQFNTAKSLAKLGKFYAKAIVEAKLDIDILFGPAYKAIPIMSSTAVALSDIYDIDLPFCFNRKEKKAYGEGGHLIGSTLEGNVLFIDDVISAGTTFKESAKLIAAHPAKLMGLITALDREERGESHLSALVEIEKNYGIQSITIATLSDVIAYMKSYPGYSQELDCIFKYQCAYGSKN